MSAAISSRFSAAPMPVVGFVTGSSIDAQPAAAFRNGLNETGYVEGQNVAVEPLAGRPIQPPAVAHGRPCPPSRGRYRHARQ